MTGSDSMSIRRPAPAGSHAHTVLEPGEASLTDTRHPEQVAGRPEATAAGPLLEDGAGGRRADAGQRVEGRQVGRVEVDRFDRRRAIGLAGQATHASDLT